MARAGNKPYSVSPSWLDWQKRKRDDSAAASNLLCLCTYRLMSEPMAALIVAETAGLLRWRVDT